LNILNQMRLAIAVAVVAGAMLAGCGGDGGGDGGSRSFASMLELAPQVEGALVVACADVDRLRDLSGFEDDQPTSSAGLQPIGERAGWEERPPAITLFPTEGFAGDTLVYLVGDLRRLLGTDYYDIEQNLVVGSAVGDQQSVLTGNFSQDEMDEKLTAVQYLLREASGAHLQVRDIDCQLLPPEDEVCILSDGAWHSFGARDGTLYSTRTQDELTALLDTEADGSLASDEGMLWLAEQLSASPALRVWSNDALVAAHVDKVGNVLSPQDYQALIAGWRPQPSPVYALSGLREADGDVRALVGWYFDDPGAAEAASAELAGRLAGYPALPGGETDALLCATVSAEAASWQEGSLAVATCELTAEGRANWGSVQHSANPGLFLLLSDPIFAVAS
jgi:hypothetical protein